MNPNKWWFVFSIALGVLVFMLSLVMGTITSAWVLYELVFGDDEDFAFYAIWPGIAFAMASTFAYWSMLRDDSRITSAVCYTPRGCFSRSLRDGWL